MAPSRESGVTRMASETEPAAVMARAYSIDLRERVIAAVTEGESVRAVREMFDVSPSFVPKLAQRPRRHDPWRA